MSPPGELTQPLHRARILVVLLGAIGDVVRAMPLAMRLRRGLPEAHLAWAVEPTAAPLLEAYQQIDEQAWTTLGRVFSAEQIQLLHEGIERWMRVTASMSGQCAMWGPGCTRGVRSRCRSCDKSGGLAFFVEIAEVGILVSHVSNGGRHGAPTSWQEIQTSTLLFPIHREENVR